MDPKTSWASKWLHLAKNVPGAYAMVINDDIPGAVQDMLEDRGIRVPHAHAS
ncbi:hypothetical protein DUNSADRAFT_14883 [Dunaliella salina]|uniref:Uncharacterized protein n=1 Tax=Dunaliella salina TaxID=3046 RepID=A0ABQ7G6I7_DUNSA|nr:hypothetical protein DUNSADRAFT_14883 [Dunaliella salina]|eukprot:KAF5830221.1 hypothetical protein DUNSADRAFT_14883 [Dunaliella salina]